MSSKTIKKEIRASLKRKADSHKGDYGRVLIIAGSPGMTGAAALTCLGALRSGAGLITLGIPKSLNFIMEEKLTEVMTYPLPQTREGTFSLRAIKPLQLLIKRHDVLAIGPGISQNAETKQLVRAIIKTTSIPLVIDADGINSLVGHSEILAKKKSSVIITPHPREFSRIFKVNVNEIQRQRKNIALRYSLKYGIIVVLKGHKTIVAHGKSSFCNITGNAGLATGGSGDVLTGIIASFLGQGIKPYLAAKYAVYIHGLAADLAARDKTQVSLIPSDLLEYLPRAFKACGCR